MAQEDEAAALRSRYLEKMTGDLPAGSAGAESVREALTAAEGTCVSFLAKEDDPSNREAMIRATEAAMIAAAELDSRMKSLMEHIGSFLRERVALARIGREPPSSSPGSKASGGNFDACLRSDPKNCWAGIDGEKRSGTSARSRRRWRAASKVVLAAKVNPGSQATSPSFS